MTIITEIFCDKTNKKIGDALYSDLYTANQMDTFDTSPSFSPSEQFPNAMDGQYPNVEINKEKTVEKLNEKGPKINGEASIIVKRLYVKKYSIKDEKTREWTDYE